MNPNSNIPPIRKIITSSKSTSDISYNIDGGNASSIYGGSITINAGTA